MRAIVVAAMILAAGPAKTETSRVVEACLQAVAHYYLRDEIFAVSVQDFAHLDPPRTTIRASTNSADDDVYSRVVDCRFENRESPLNLTRMCVDLDCGELGNPRIDEIADLLARDGY